jgi:hypothetical protein
LQVLLPQLGQLGLEKDDLIFCLIQSLLALLQAPFESLCSPPQFLLMALQGGKFEQALVLQLVELVVLESPLPVFGAEPAIEVLPLSDGVLQLCVLGRQGLELVQQVLHPTTLSTHLIS